jgi:hypothetical protein
VTGDHCSHQMPNRRMRHSRHRPEKGPDVGITMVTSSRIIVLLLVALSLWSCSTVKPGTKPTPSDKGILEEDLKDDKRSPLSEESRGEQAAPVLNNSDAPSSSVVPQPVDPALRPKRRLKRQPDGSWG